MTEKLKKSFFIWGFGCFLIYSGHMSGCLISTLIFYTIGVIIGILLRKDL